MSRTGPYYLIGVIVLLAVSVISANHLANAPKVFGTFWASGNAANHHQNPYAIQPETFRVYIPALNLHTLDPNLNPPCLLPIFQALARIPIPAAARVFTAISFLIFALSGALLVGNIPEMKNKQALWILVSAPAIYTILIGQIYALLLLLSVCMWLAMRRNAVGAAAVFLGASIAIKPIFAIWLLIIALRGIRALAWRAAVAAVAFTLFPVAIYGPHVFRQWFAAAAHDQHYLYLPNISLYAIGQRIGVPTTGAIAALLVFILCVYVALRGRLSEPSSHILGIVCSCLCAPLSWYVYLIAAYPWLVERPWNRLYGWAVLILLVPELTVAVIRGTYTSPLALAFGTLICMTPALLLLADAIRQTYKTLRPPPEQLSQSEMP